MQILNYKEGLECECKTTDDHAFLEIILCNPSHKWPDKLELVCLSGQAIGHREGVPSLDTGEQHQVQVYLTNPKEVGQYSTKWALQYVYHNTLYVVGTHFVVNITVIDQNEDFNKLLTQSGISLQATDKAKMLVDIYKDENIQKQEIIDLIKQHGEEKPMEDFVVLFNSILDQQQKQQIQVFQMKEQSSQPNQLSTHS